MRRTAAVLSLIALALALSAGCRDERSPRPSQAAPKAASALQIQAWALPTGDARAAQPDLVVAPDGTLLLSWIEGGDGKAHRLRFARFDGARWSEPHTIAEGTDWFVNWADTPHLAATADGALWAHWLRKSAAATYAYDVVLARSGDGGASWSAPMPVNDDGTPTEHGFVAMWPASRDHVGIAWLDGRHTGGEGHGGHGGGAMTLRTARFDGALGRHDETELDASTCDCCQTAAVMTADGPLLVYRDRTDEEIRDIVAVRLGDDGWTAPTPVHADGWRMPACPVNGPGLAAHGKAVVVGWYTAPSGTPEVRLAASADGGRTFGAPITLESGAAVQGRVSVALDANDAWVLWLREDAGGQSLQLARFAPDLSAERGRIELGRPEGKGRGTGFPQLALRGGVPHVVWIDAGEGGLRLRGVTVRAGR